MKYRSEVDGLRALAVVPVILFHAGFSFFSGGFVGVDVFFVISGYLITLIILDDVDGGGFSFLDFYERRARRILPALFVVIVFCAILSFFIMMPSQLKDFSGSIVATALFFSNVFFWKDSGYFDAAAEEKPLLHTWSLAVEEQFYLFFPFFLILCLRRGSSFALWAIFLMAVLSLFISEWGWRHERLANFYLLPPRVWELLVGSISAFVTRRGPDKSDALSCLGLLGIIFSVFFYDKETPFPSFYTIVPVLGTALVLVFSGNGTVVSRVLSIRPIVGVGLVSYSAYLWHQPLFAFSRLWFLTDPPQYVMGLLSVATLVLATLSWWMVERPFRKRENFGRRAIYAMSALMIVTCLSMSPILKAGMGYFYNEHQMSIVMAGEEGRQFMSAEAYDRFGCFFDYSQSPDQLIDLGCVSQSDRGRLILFGDSEAAHLYNGFLSSGLNLDVMQFTGTSCRSINYSGNTERCAKFYNLFMSDVLPSLRKDDVVVVSSNWWATYKNVDPVDFDFGLEDIVSKIQRTGAAVILLTNAPEFYQNPYELLAVSNSDMAEKFYLPTQPIIESDRAIEEVASRLDADVFDISELLCREDDMCIFRGDGEYFYFDAGHFSYYGSGVVATAIAERFGFLSEKPQEVVESQ